MSGCCIYVCIMHACMKMSKCERGPAAAALACATVLWVRGNRMLTTQSFSLMLLLWATASSASSSGDQGPGWGGQAAGPGGVSIYNQQASNN